MEVDTALLSAVRKMDEDALIKIFDKYAPALFRYVMRSCDDPLIADNIVGDVFSRLLDQLSTGQGPTSNLRSYLFEAAYHSLVDQVRYFRRRIPLENLDFMHSDAQTSYLNLENHILYEAASQLVLGGLTEYQRNIIILRFFEGFSLRETADILGKSVNIVRAAQNRAIQTLRKDLKQWAIA